jgi:hypothetical protein
MSKENGNYDVGYGKPPKSGQFKKGKSGNSKGRPKGARGLKADLKAELSEVVTITENGKSRKFSKQQLVIKQLMNKALKSDIRALSKLLDLNISILGVEGEAKKGPVSLSMSDQAILDNYVKSQIEEGIANDE